MSESGPAIGSYRSYWMAWMALLGITLLMLLLTHPAILVVGMTVKAVIILFWFMHLRQERSDMVVWILFGILFMGLLLFGLIVPDANAM